MTDSLILLSVTPGSIRNNSADIVTSEPSPGCHSCAFHQIPAGITECLLWPQFSSPIHVPEPLCSLGYAETFSGSMSRSSPAWPTKTSPQGPSQGISCSQLRVPALIHERVPRVGYLWGLTQAHQNV